MARSAAPISAIGRTHVNNATNTLRALPEKEPEQLSLKAAIAVMHKEIEATLKRGYSFDEVAEILTKNGIQIKAGTLKQYLREIRRRKSGRQSAARTKTVNDTPEPVEVPAKLETRKPAARRKSAKTRAAKHATSFIEVPDEL